MLVFRNLVFSEPDRERETIFVGDNNQSCGCIQRRRSKAHWKVYICHEMGGMGQRSECEQI